MDVIGMSFMIGCWLIIAKDIIPFLEFIHPAFDNDCRSNRRRKCP